MTGWTHTVEVYRDRRGFWRWRAKARNGQIVADCAEGYGRKRDAVKAIRNLLGGTVRWVGVDE